ncbi:MAG: hypothetical protein H5T91_00135 [Synergistetes bacterium]|nr:MAG: Conserved hypothetical secreted protein [bacterium 42_11]MBC7330824.1 hypothetical protein [Synergistota bacterium]
MKMRKVGRRLALALFLACAVLVNLAWAESFNLSLLFDEAFQKVGKVDLVITNIGYSRGSEALLDEFYRELMKRDIPVKSLVNLHSAYDKPLYFAFLNKKTGRLFYVDGSRKAVEDVSYQATLSEADKWNEKIKSKVFGGSEFALLSVSQLFSLDVPYDLHKAIEFHNHVCPGLLSGYLIAEFLRGEVRPGERLMVFAVPSWCKDDALQVIFDTTVGKKGMYVRGLRGDEEKAFPDVAGIYVLWSDKDKRGRGLVLSFDFKALRRESGATDDDYPWLWRLKGNYWVMKNLDRARGLVGKMGEFEVDEELLGKLKKMELRLEEVLKR